MNATQQKNAKLFLQLLAKSNLPIDGKWQYRKLKSDGFMDLSIDRLMTGQNSQHFALAHNTVQNGDNMADPDMEIVFFPGETPYMEARHYQNDFAGAYHTVERGNATQCSLDDFLKMWLVNLLEQGHVADADKMGDDKDCDE